MLASHTLLGLLRDEANAIDAADKQSWRCWSCLTLVSVLVVTKGSSNQWSPMRLHSGENGGMRIASITQSL